LVSLNSATTGSFTPQTGLSVASGFNVAVLLNPFGFSVASQQCYSALELFFHGDIGQPAVTGRVLLVVVFYSELRIERPFCRFSFRVGDFCLPVCGNHKRIVVV
jgi:hypothetical protein